MSERYGCIAKTLQHSFSKEIHARIAPYTYELIELSEEELPLFMTKKDFRAINVTIPYKERVIPYLSHIDGAAAAIGAVNTVVNRDGALHGYNTDVYGMTQLLRHAGIEIRGKKVLILGTGGTAKTAQAVACAEGASTVLRVSRTAREEAILYEDMYRDHTDAEIIINTTPVGMFPHMFDTPVDIDRFPALSGVIDAVYNPLRTPLILSARERGIPAEGGLYMLVAQAVRAAEIFTDTSYGEDVITRVYTDILRAKENIVLIGMPASGKSTVGRRLAEQLSRPLLDTDTDIERTVGMCIPDIFRERGEAQFRSLECEVIRRISAACARVIATGGGAILCDDNVRALRENGRLYFLDRPLEQLVPTADRPLASDRKAIEQRYRERYDRYMTVCDVRVDGKGSPDEVADRIQGDFCK